MKHIEADGWGDPSDPSDTVVPFTSTVLTSLAGSFCQVLTAPFPWPRATTSGTGAARPALRPVPAELPARPHGLPWTCLHITDSDEDPPEAC